MIPDETRPLQRVARTRLPFAHIALVVCAAVAGCGDGATPDAASQPFVGQTVVLSVPAGLAFRESWEVTLNDWSSQTGAQVQLEERSATELKTAPPGSLVVFPATHVADWISVDALSPLPTGGGLVSEGSEQFSVAEVPGLGWEDAFLGLRDRLATLDKRPAVLPVGVPVLVLYYRDDLLAKARLSPPETWDEYQQLVEKLAHWAPGLTVEEPWHPDFRATMFLARAISAAQHPGHHAAFFDVDSGAPRIHSPPYERALERVGQFLKSLPEANREKLLLAQPADCRREILAGRAALAIAFETGPGDPQTPFLATTKSGGEAKRASQEMTIGVVRLPGVREVYNPSRQTWDPAPDRRVHSVTLTGFAGLVAGVRSGGPPKVAEAAWNLAGRLWSSESPSPHPAGTFSPFRESDLADVSRFTGTALQGAETQAYSLALAESLRDRRLVVELPVVGRAEFRAALTQGLTRVLSAEAAPQEALRKVAADWRDITSRLGAEKVRVSYRRCLGLSR